MGIDVDIARRRHLRPGDVYWGPGPACHRPMVCLCRRRAFLRRGDDRVFLFQRDKEEEIDE